MSDYSPLWSPGDPVRPDEKLTDDEKQALLDQAESAGNWTEKDQKDWDENDDSADQTIDE